MINYKEYKTHSDRLSDILPWGALIAPGVILNKNGSFQRTIQYRGPDLESHTAPQLVAASSRLNNALKRLGSGWAFFIESRRRSALNYPEENQFPEPLSWLIDEERKTQFSTEKTYFESDYYITFVYLMPPESVSRLSDLFISKPNGSKETTYHKPLEFFISSTDRLLDILKDVMFQADFLTDEETLTYLHACVSTKDHVVKVPQVPMYLDSVLADTPLIGGLQPKLGDNHLRVISICGFPSVTIPAILDQLNYLPIEYRWCSRYLPLDKIDAEKILKNYRRKWFAKRKGILSLVMESFSKTESAMVDNASVRKSQDADLALQELADDCVTFGYFTATITIWDKDLQVVNDKSREVERVINGMGFATVSETVNAVDAWLSSLPGQTYANVRIPIIHSLNLSHTIPFSAVWAGPAWNRHLDAPPLMHVSTAGHTPFRYSNHVSDVGHQMIVGPTGAGKSVLMSMICLQFLRYESAQVFIFDKGGSFLASTMGVNGQYYQIGSTGERGLVFQPLAGIDDPAECAFFLDWVVELVENEGMDIDPERKEAIWSALQTLASAPVEQRTLTGLKALIQDKDIRLALVPFTLGGAYGDLLDADLEIFHEKDWQCFEMDVLMNMPAIIPPVMTYIFHVLEKRFDGRPTLLILDEAWLFLGNSAFAKKIREWLKTLRKKNVSVIFSTQSVNDIINHPIAPALIESCPSRVFLPNDRALEPSVADAYVSLGLNERQLHIIANATPKRQYYYESNVGNGLFDLQLSQLALSFVGVSTPEDQKALWKLWEENPIHAEFLKAYLLDRGLDWAIELLEQVNSDD